MWNADRDRQINPSEYPAEGPPADRLRFLLRYAVLAPSSHNTQPWRFRMARSHVDLYADRQRRLPVVDPGDRALLISCGAALGTMEAAARGFGDTLAIETLPDPATPDWVARVTLGPKRAADPAESQSLDAIARRRTTRRQLGGDLPEGLRDTLLAIAAEAHVELAVLSGGNQKTAIARLVEQGDRAQFGDPAFRRELSEWVRSRRSRSRDGMSGANFGMPDRLSWIGRQVIRHVDMGKSIGAADRQLAQRGSAILVVATGGDGPADWIRAGVAHAKLLLAVAARGWTAAYMNQPIEVAALRPRLAAAAGIDGWPQLMMRIGHGPAVTPAVRRPLQAVVVEAAAFPASDEP